ncbi:MAG TPA: CBS domain-containing protein [Patescibacteria group bacterium]|nr:CBS domain-containing protein [Patescibacteria group bacterium]
MTVADVMQTDIITIPKGTLWRKAAQILLHNKISGAPVVDKDNHVIGVISEKDLFRSLYPTYHDWYECPDSFINIEQMEQEARSAAQERAVEEFMSKRLLTVSPKMPVVQVGALMMSTGIHRVPVLDQGKLVGMVGRQDVFRAILKESLHMSSAGEEIIS